MNVVSGPVQPNFLILLFSVVASMDLILDIAIRGTECLGF